jgi:hypothetical protein
MITTYLTSAEAELLYPLSSGTDNFSALLKAKALEMSFGLVDSVISTQVATPIIARWNGETGLKSIDILKDLQLRYYRYILERSNVGDTQEMIETRRAIDEDAQAIRVKHFDIPTLTPEIEVGWRVTEITNTSNLGTIYIRGDEPSESYHYKLVITSSGANYVGEDDVEFSVYRTDDDTPLSTGNTATYDNWQTIDSKFDVRWDGQWTLNDEVQITGTPRSAVNTSGAPITTIQQSEAIW